MSMRAHPFALPLLALWVANSAGCPAPASSRATSPPRTASSPPHARRQARPSALPRVAPLPRRLSEAEARARVEALAPVAFKAIRSMANKEERYLTLVGFCRDLNGWGKRALRDRIAQEAFRLRRQLSSPRALEALEGLALCLRGTSSAVMTPLGLELLKAVERLARPMARLKRLLTYLTLEHHRLPETLARALYKSAFSRVQRKPKPRTRGDFSRPLNRAGVLATLPAVAASLGATSAPKALRRLKKLIDKLKLFGAVNLDRRLLSAWGHVALWYPAALRPAVAQLRKNGPTSGRRAYYLADLLHRMAKDLPMQAHPPKVQATLLDRIAAVAARIRDRRLRGHVHRGLGIGAADLVARGGAAYAPVLLRFLTLADSGRRSEMLDNVLARLLPAQAARARKLFRDVLILPCGKGETRRACVLGRLGQLQSGAARLGKTGVPGANVAAVERDALTLPATDRLEALLEIASLRLRLGQRDRARRLVSKAWTAAQRSRPAPLPDKGPAERWRKLSRKEKRAAYERWLIQRARRSGAFLRLTHAAAHLRHAQAAAIRRAAFAARRKGSPTDLLGVVGALLRRRHPGAGRMAAWLLREELKQAAGWKAHFEDGANMITDLLPETLPRAEVDRALVQLARIKLHWTAKRKRHALRLRYGLARLRAKLSPEPDIRALFNMKGDSIFQSTAKTYAVLLATHLPADAYRKWMTRFEAWVKAEPVPMRARRRRSALVTGLLFGKRGVGRAWLDRLVASGKRYWQGAVVIPHYYRRPATALRARSILLRSPRMRAGYLLRVIERLRRDDFRRRRRLGAF